jgi:hypothetical protein
MENVLIELVNKISPHDLTVIVILVITLRFARSERKNKEGDE